MRALLSEKYCRDLLACVPRRAFASFGWQDETQAKKGWSLHVGASTAEVSSTTMAGAAPKGDSEDNAMMVVESSVGHRTTEMQKLRQEIQDRLKRIQALEDAHESHVLKASLLCDAEYHYSKIFMWRYKQKWKKENLLLALQSDVVPDILLWKNFDMHCPRRLKNDRDILLSRLKLDDFEEMFVHEAFQVPSKFRNDREVMLAVCAKNSHALELASKKLRDDFDVVLAAIQQKYWFAPLALQYASLRLRGDKKLVRVALNREHGIRCAKYLAPKLQSDHRLILTSIRRSSHECSEWYEHLSELPESLRADEDIVMAAVRKRGSNLRFVTAPEIAQDLDVALAACKQDGNAIQFVPKGPTRKELKQRKYQRTIVVNGGGAALRYKYSSKLYDEDFLLAAIENGLTDIQNLNDIFLKNRPLLLKMLRLSGQLYRALPDELKVIHEFAFASLESESLDEKCAISIFKRIPELFSNEKAMLIVAKKGFFEVLSRAPEEMLDIKSIMMAGCRADGALLEICSKRLLQDPDVISAALASEIARDCAFLVPTEVFKQNPMIAEQAIKSYDGKDWRRLFDHLPLASFHNRRVLLAWLEQDWGNSFQFPFYRIVHDGDFEHDREVILAILAHNFRLNMLGACECLHQDREFVQKAIQVDGRVINHIDSSLRRDFDMLLLAVGMSRKCLQAFDHESGPTIDDLVDFAKKVRERLKVADIFILEFLRGIDIVTPHVAPAKRCRLPNLDRGYETGAGFKRLIAQYAGVPLGKELSLLRDASANLKFWGY